VPRTGPPHENPYPPHGAAGASGTARLPGTDPAGGPAGGSEGRAGRAVIAALAGAVGALVAVGAIATTGHLGGGTTTVIEREPAPAPVVTTPSASPDPRPPVAGVAAPDSVQDVVARSSPAVVKITIGGEDGPPSGRLGSGFMIDDDGLLLTNSHVVEDAPVADVTFEDGTETRAEVLGRDESTDLAVLRAREVPDGVRPLELGTSLSLVVGDPVIAIGNPFGLERTATVGIVSALKRIIRAPNDFEIQNVIQTDAAINQGNSGGPLLDGAGRVIGINTQIATGSGGNDGIGFAVPVDTVRPVVDAIVRTGAPAHAWLGVTGRTITPAVARRLGHPDVRGVAVVRVDERGPASAAGLRAATTPLDADVPRGGDVIVAVEGREVTDMADVSRAVSSRAVGAELTLTVLRGDRRIDLTVKLGDRPGDVGVAPRP
jgi:S1-C subfamily serine protease